MMLATPARPAIVLRHAGAVRHVYTESYSSPWESRTMQKAGRERLRSPLYGRGSLISPAAATSSARWHHYVGSNEPYRDMQALGVGLSGEPPLSHSRRIANHVLGSNTAWRTGREMILICRYPQQQQCMACRKRRC